MRPFALSLGLSCALALPAQAADIVLGVGSGVANGNGDDDAFAVIEAHSDPLWAFAGGDLSGVAVLQSDTDADTFVGAGVSVQFPLRGDWFLEGSFAVGYYDQGAGGTNLGGNLQFRTLGGIGRKIGARGQVSLALDHISNANTNVRNPGMESLSLRYRVSF